MKQTNETFSIHNFVYHLKLFAWLEFTIYVKKLEASYNMQKSEHKICALTQQSNKVFFV